MPAYEICYMNDDSSLACTLVVVCRDDLHAKIFSHAMKLGDCKRFEVWQDRKLVYERPLHFGDAALPSDLDNLPAPPPNSSPAQQPIA
ncbi:MAG TPA: hypothetical protein VII49_01780 [Rhizomicrobium sp.]